MNKNDKKSKVLKLYKKQKIVKLLSTKYVLPLTALFLLLTATAGILLAIVFKKYGLGGAFAGLGLSSSIVSLTYLLVVNGEDNSFVESRLEKLKNDMEETKEINQFEKDMYNNVEILMQQEENLNKTKNLINELTQKLKSKQDGIVITDGEKQKLVEEKFNLVKQKAIVEQQKKDIKKLQKHYIKYNEKLKKLNPDLDVEYIGETSDI